MEKDISTILLKLRAAHQKIYWSWKFNYFRKF